MTDYRALCVELLAWADKASARYYQAPDVLVRARAALAEPQPAADGEVVSMISTLACAAEYGFDDRVTASQTLRRAADLLERLTDGPTVQSREPASVVEQPSDEELESFLIDVAAQSGVIYWKALARAVLSRWGNHPAQPIPVSERLPEAEDCDAEGRCWIHMPDIGTAPSWRLVDPREIGPYHTHWLPAAALPLPSGEVTP